MFRSHRTTCQCTRCRFLDKYLTAIIAVLVIVDVIWLFNPSW